MGCIVSKTEADLVSIDINRALKDDQKRINREIKMLLLGMYIYLA